MARILLAEDDAHTIRVMQLWLTRHKHTVIESGNGREAVERLRSMSVDMLISDVNMPQMGGMDLIRAVRRELGLTIPILMFSSRCDHADLALELKELDIHLYPKPFVPSKLCQRIEQLLGEAAAGRGPGAAGAAPVTGPARGCGGAGAEGHTREVGSPGT